MQTKLTFNSKVYEQSIFKDKKQFAYFSVIDIALSKGNFLNFDKNLNQKSNFFGIFSQFCFKQERKSLRYARLRLQLKIYELKVIHISKKSLGIK